MTEASSDDQKEILVVLKEIARWVRFQAIQTARQLLGETLKKDAEKLVYHYSDGKPSLEIAKLAGVSDFTVRSYWRKWGTMGLVVPSDRFKGRFERLLSLEDLGVEVPAPRSIEIGEADETGGRI